MTVGGKIALPGTGAAIGDHETRLRRLEWSLGGGAVVPYLEALWWGVLPPAVAGQAGGVWSVPFIAGVSQTWNVTRTYFRFESPGVSGTYEVELQWSAAGSTFVPHAIDDLSLAAGANEVVHSPGPFGTISSGDLLRADWLTLGFGAQVFTIQLEGTPV